MAYFDKIKDFFVTRGVYEDKILNYLTSPIIIRITENKDYEKDYLQIIELEKKENYTFKISIRQEEVDDVIKENKIEFYITCPYKEEFKNFNISKLYLKEDEEYNGITQQTLLLPKEN
ncbi:hypothetical protein [uncultured Fusobacterium sp.]|uniref:hypothetical protein n=1 Tax=uncultured Fusobacterium sp. TaxID=159267 RepID=UPI00265E9885|nr:hypothetical protein [uncultured Fusobacterium sp.]